MKLSTSKSSISIPVGGILPWIEHNRSVNPNTYGYRVGACTSNYHVGHSFTGQDLINLGYAEGENFRIQLESRRVVVDQSVIDSVVRVYVNPSTTTPNAVVSGTTIAEVINNSSSFKQSSIIETTSAEWTASTNFVVAWNQTDYNSSREHYTQYKNFSILKLDNILPPNFHKCDGTVINDIDSPINGSTIPNLNGEERFLRGHNTSNTTGGGAHRHSITPTSYLSDSGSGGSSNPHGHLEQSTVYYSDYTEATPPFYNIIWIMRIK